MPLTQQLKESSLPPLSFRLYSNSISPSTSEGKKFLIGSVSDGITLERFTTGDASGIALVS